MADDDLTLSASTLAALNEFLKEESSRKEEFAKLSSQAEARFDESENGARPTMDLFKEDWQLSQFWYNDKTADTLAKELLQGANKDTWIIIVSAPSVYGALNKLPKEEIPTEHIYLLEFDDRFKILSGADRFAHYDFSRPLELPREYKNRFDRVLIDPPFLSQDCQTKAAVTARWLLKPETESDQTRTIVCTGERMGDLIKKVYPGTHVTDFFPEHAKGLSNEFRCYANYEGASWKFLKE